MIVEVNPIVNRVEVYEGAVYVPTQLPLSLQTIDTQAEANRAYVFDTTDGALSLTLPITANLGETVEIACFGANSVTVITNGHNINGLSNNLSLVSLTSVKLRYVNSTIGWFSFS